MFRNVNVRSGINDGNHIVSVSWTWEKIEQEKTMPNCTIVVLKLPEELLLREGVFGKGEALRWIHKNVVDLENASTRQEAYTSLVNRYRNEYEVASYKRQLSNSENMNDGYCELILKKSDIDKIIYLCVFSDEKFEEFITPVYIEENIDFSLVKPKLINKVMARVKNKSGGDLWSLCINKNNDKPCVLVCEFGGTVTYSVLPEAQTLYLSEKTAKSIKTVKYLSSFI